MNKTCIEILEEKPHKNLIITPKCREAFQILNQEITLGYPNGYSELKPSDYSQPSDWRGRNIHILGSSPQKQYKIIQKLTQPTLTNEPPANITSMDWNGVHLGALKGQYWHPDKWQDADHLTIRETVRNSLQEIKGYWEDLDLWPETTPREFIGPATQTPTDYVSATTGDQIESLDELEDSIIARHENYGDLAFSNSAEKKFFEHREPGNLEEIPRQW